MYVHIIYIYIYACIPTYIHANLLHGAARLQVRARAVDELMYISIYLSMSIYRSIILSISKCLAISLYTHTYLYIYIHTYIYI